MKDARYEPLARVWTSTTRATVPILLAAMLAAVASPPSLAEPLVEKAGEVESMGAAGSMDLVDERVNASIEGEGMLEEVEDPVAGDHADSAAWLDGEASEPMAEEAIQDVLAAGTSAIAADGYDDREDAQLLVADSESQVESDVTRSDSNDSDVLKTQAVSLSGARVVKNTRMNSGQVATWDCIWFGSYPQTEITSENAVWTKLQSAPWDANGDAAVGGVRYRRVALEDDPTYHYFRYDPIKWRVLNVSGTTALVLADVALDVQCYNVHDTGVTWENSSMRSWLNGYGSAYNQPGINYASKGFVNTAFGASERGAILSTNVRNENNSEYDTHGGNDTQDAVFLLSEREVYSTLHGFSNNHDTRDEARMCKMSDFLKFVGETGGDSIMWGLRSPGIYENCLAVTDITGIVYPSGIRVHSGVPVRPALRLDTSSSGVQLAGSISSNGVITEASAVVSPVPAVPIASVTPAVTSLVYDGMAKGPAVTVRTRSMTVPSTGYSVSYANNRNAGTATITVRGNEYYGYTGTLTTMFTITKAANKVSVKAKQSQVTTAYSSSKAKGIANVVVSGAAGKVTYSNVSTDAVAKKFSVNGATGKLTIAKGTKVGTYAVRIRVAAAGDKNHKAGSKTISFKLRVGKAANTLAFKARAQVTKASVLRKASTAVKPIKVSKANGSVSYAKVSGSRCLTVNKRNGSIIVRKGTKAGTYLIRIKVVAAGNANYKKASKTVLCKVSVA